MCSEEQTPDQRQLIRLLEVGVACREPIGKKKEMAGAGGGLPTIITHPFGKPFGIIV